MVLTFWCAGDLRNAPIEVVGAQWEGERRRGKSKGYNADKCRARTVGWPRSIRGAYMRFT